MDAKEKFDLKERNAMNGADSIEEHGDVAVTAKPLAASSQLDGALTALSVSKSESRTQRWLRYYVVACPLILILGLSLSLPSQYFDLIHSNVRIAVGNVLLVLMLWTLWIIFLKSRTLTRTKESRLGLEEIDADVEFAIVKKILKNRAKLMKSGVGRLARAIKLDKDSSQGERLVRMVATDLFVEKAQRFLTQRANQLFLYGFVTLASAIVILLGGAYVARALLGGDPPSKLDATVLTLRLFQASAFATFILVAVFMLNAFSRSFYHEGTKLRERRHALRFGRLYMYLKADEFKADEFEKVFDWNRNTTSAFQNIKDVSPDTLQNRLLSLVPDIIRRMRSQEKKGEAKESSDSNDGSGSETDKPR